MSIFNLSVRYIKNIIRCFCLGGFLSLTAWTISCSADNKVEIDDFSDTYYAVLEITGAGDYFSYGTLIIYDKNNKKEMFRSETQIATSDIHSIRSNIKELPYGEQSMIIHEDFNFDGIKDFAICDGNNSCYAGPSYQIFIAKNGGFIRDEDFTRLAQEYCGMFRTDPEDKRIYTMTKSGCCWHQHSEFSVLNNKPRLEKETEFGTGSLPHILHEVTRIRKDGKMEEEEHFYFDPEGLPEESILLSFLIPRGKEDNKRMYLLYANKHLQYFFVKEGTGEIELHYPGKDIYYNEDYKWTDDYTFADTDHELSIEFTRPGVKYKIYETLKTIGILVWINNKEYNLKGDKVSQIGTLRDLAEKIEDLKNR